MLHGAGDSNTGLLGFKATSTTTAPADLTILIRYCPVFKTVALTLFSSATVNLTGYLAIGPTAGDRLNNIIHFVKNLQNEYNINYITLN